MHEGVQIIKGDYVLVPRAQYEQLLKRRQPSDAHLVNDILESARHGTTSMIPSEVVDMVLDKGYSRIRAWRLHRGLKLVELGKKTGLTGSYISQIELGKRTASVSVLRKLALAFGTGIDALLVD